MSPSTKMMLQPKTFSQTSTRAVSDAVVGLLSHVSCVLPTKANTLIYSRTHPRTYARKEPNRPTP